MDKGVIAEELPGFFEGILHNLWRDISNLEKNSHSSQVHISSGFHAYMYIYSIFIFYLEGSIQELPFRFTQKLPLEWCGDNKGASVLQLVCQPEGSPHTYGNSDPTEMKKNGFLKSINIHNILRSIPLIL